MRQLFLLISYIFHPLFVPMAGTIAYFLVTPKYTPLEVQSGNILPVFILTIIIPIISFFILRNLGVVNSVFLRTEKERVFPLIICIAILLMILIKVIPNNYTAELYYFFVGILLSSLACLILAILDFKASIHMIAVGGVLMFFIALSIHFSINISGSIALLFLIAGAVGTSRLHLKAHNKVELLIGVLIGIIPQMILLNYWL